MLIKKRALFLILLAFGLGLPTFSQIAPPQPQFISFEAAKATVSRMGDSVPADLKRPTTEAIWSAWVQSRDREIRNRLDRGEEDTLTNLLRFGVTFTKEYRLENQYMVRYGHSSLVDSFADHRADDLIRALASPSANEGMLQMRAFVQNKGYSLNNAEGRKKLKRYLLGNLGRMQQEMIAYNEQLKDATLSQESHLYETRGISLDTNLFPDFALDQQLRRMVKEGKLKPGSIRRIGIVGPGLDFANKDIGNDFYPPQTIQPFAIIDSLLRLGVADSSSLQIYTLDISSNVNLHLQRARKKAQGGVAYTVQLPLSSMIPLEQDFAVQFDGYWRTLGEQIGTSVDPIPMPSGATGTKIRAVKIRPEFVKRITPVDMNIVFQRLVLPPDQKFDLVIGTNIFIYYGAFEQSLARANLATMIKPGGFLLSSELLADKDDSNLVELMRTAIELSRNPHIAEAVFCYRREH